MKLPWKSGEITDKNAMWSTEINYGDGNGDGHGEGWSKIVKDGKRQWELVSPHFHRTFTVFRRSTFVRQMLQNFGYVDEHSYRKKSGEKAVKLPWKSGEITVKNAMWSKEININFSTVLIKSFV